MHIQSVSSPTIIYPFEFDRGNFLRNATAEHSNIQGVPIEELFSKIAIF